MTKKELTEYIKSEALRLGFTVCGIAKAETVSDDVIAGYNSWIEAGKHGTMHYLQRNCEKRFDPTQLVEGCKSVIVAAMNYAPEKEVDGIAWYATGSDYHKIVKDRLHLLLQSINSVQKTYGRPFCDSAPVLERYWAMKAGLGWIARNRQLTIKGRGSCFFIGELLIDIELDYDRPTEKSYCGECRKCFDSCPTGALSEEGFDARKCLSYLTIEYRGDLPENIGEKMKKTFYGCDCCIKACPHNRFSAPTLIAEFEAKEELLSMKTADWKELTKEKYDTLFADSAVERCGYEQLMRNIKAIKSDNGKSL